MSTDRELLELAAKAAGITLGAWCDVAGAFMYRDGYPGRGYWNPLAADGDVFRLAVKMNIDVVIGQGRSDAYCKGVRVSEYHGDDPLAATRRAIVLAAAEIGRRMP